MTVIPLVPARTAVAVHVRGVVQGVGFRPFVHRIALRHGIAGSVRNESGEVRIAAEGAEDSVRAFLADLMADAPPLARIEALDVQDAEASGAASFAILDSVIVSDRRQPVAPDAGICDACAGELFDAANRRYRYPFTTCADCGPRYTVIEAMPYDRERTSMRHFPQCPTCLAEYYDPTNRRYHAESNSCPACGPRLWLVRADGTAVCGVAEALDAAGQALLSGRIVALRGLGGFHLAVDATDAAAVRRLRERKHRDAKPFAVMVRTLEEARELGEVNEAEAALLTSPRRPIVLLRQLAETGLAPDVAPNLDTIGVMLVYTPLHHLLLDLVRRPLVMTSGNIGDEPIAIANDDAQRRLAGVADLFLLHDREIVSRYDDSVVRVADGAPVFIRRSRGYAPLPLTLPIAAPVPLLAVGPQLKNTFTLAHDRTAYVSQHIGDLESVQTLEHFHATLEAYRRLFAVTPEIVVRDRHPGYLSTRIAEEMGVRVIAVQHHHAHVAAVLAEHDVTDEVVGVAFDGTGYGDDGHIWGAEVLVASLTAYRRVGQLRYAPLPGGDLAVRRPWRAALGYLSTAPEFAGSFARAFDGIDEAERRAAEFQIQRLVNAPLASSMGRLFDAAAAVLGVRQVAQYEGQAAMELEALAGSRAATPLTLPEHEIDGRWVLDPVPLLAQLGRLAMRGEDIGLLAARFHESVSAGAAALVRRVCVATGIRTVALAGGSFQNARLLWSMRHRLAADRLTVLVPRQLSPNDSAISYGQAAVAAAQLARGISA